MTDEDLYFISFYFENYFPYNRIYFTRNIQLIYVAQEKCKDGYKCSLVATDQRNHHYVLGYATRPAFREAFKYCLTEMLVQGIDNLLYPILNPLDDKNGWRVFILDQVTINKMIKNKTICYYKYLEENENQ